ncbi:MAG TPA: PaaI family thioesterase [Allosphingosinicella sp.]
MNERRYGVASAEEMSGMSGREMLQAMIEGRLPAPPMSHTLGFRLVEVGDGLAVFEGEPSADLLNPLGTVHGGWALTLIDSAAGCAAHTRLPAGVGYTTVETKVNMTRAIAADTGTIRAEGRVVAEGRRIVTTEARMLDGKGRILAHGTSTIMVLHPR